MVCGAEIYKVNLSQSLAQEDAMMRQTLSKSGAGTQNQPQPAPAQPQPRKQGITLSAPGEEAAKANKGGKSNCCKK